MIPARIISIDDKVIVEWPPEPEKFDIKNMIFDVQAEVLKRSVIAYDESKTIAEVENVMYRGLFNYWFVTAYYGEVDYKERLEVNQQVFIEPTETGKCKIVKIN